MDDNIEDTSLTSGNIRCIDFFEKEKNLPHNIDLIIGNPPWGSIATDQTPAGQWCTENKKLLPDKQISAAFVWKATKHISMNGKICFVLPHGVLFNHSPKAVAFQKAWVSQHTLERVMNLADFRWFLFGKAVHPAIVVNYKNEKPNDLCHHIDYWVPKTDWKLTQTELITISPLDKIKISLRDLLKDLNGEDAPQSWTQSFWASPRDMQFIERLSFNPRLRDHVRKSREVNSSKPWVMAEGFQPVGKSDDPEKAKTLKLPSKKFIPATSSDLDLFLLQDSCINLDSASIEVRNRSNKNTEIFKAPHVLVSEGFTNAVFANFDVSFQDALRGIHGPKSDEDLLAFLAAYLRSPLAKYYLFHTSSNWGIARPVVRVQELQRLPLPFPDQQPDPKRSWVIVKKVSKIIQRAANKAENNFLTRHNAIENATSEIEPLIEEYFDIQPLEKLLIEDTLNIIIPSIQPTRKRMPVPTVMHSSKKQQNLYVKRICDTLNQWAQNGEYLVRGTTLHSDALGVGMAVLEKVHTSKSSEPIALLHDELLKSLNQLREVAACEQGTINLARGVMVFENNLLYILKPLGQRHWSQTTALNDADELAGTLLMHSFGADA